MYYLKEPIASGGFGTVFEAIHKPTKEVRAVKMIKKKYCDKEEMNLLINEV